MRQMQHEPQGSMVLAFNKPVSKVCFLQASGQVKARDTSCLQWSEHLDPFPRKPLFPMMRCFQHCQLLFKRENGLLFLKVAFLGLRQQDPTSRKRAGCGFALQASLLPLPAFLVLAASIL